MLLPSHYIALQKANTSDVMPFLSKAMKEFYLPLEMLALWISLLPLLSKILFTL